MATDRRRYARLNETEGVSSPRSKTIKGRNISLGGICLVLENKLGLGEVIDVNFHLPASTTRFRARAKVVWQDRAKEGYQTGLEFIRIRVEG